MRERHDRRRSADWLAPVAVAVVGLLLTLLSWNVARGTLADSEERRDERLADTVADQISEELRRYTDVLRGAAGLYASSREVDAREFRSYVSALELDERYPGARVLLVVDRTADGPAIRFAEPSTAAVLPVGTLVADRPDFAAFAEALAAADRAGTPVMSRTLTFDDVDGLTAHGFFVVLPLADFSGWVGVRVDPDRMLADVIERTDPAARVSVFEREADRSVRAVAEVGEPGRDMVAATRTVLGRQWLVEVSGGSDRAGSDERSQPWVVLIAGLLVTGALTWVVGHQVRSRRNALVLLDRAIESETRLERLIDVAPVAVIEVDGRGGVRRWNAAAVEMFGGTASERVGQPLDIVIRPAEAGVAAAAGAPDRALADLLDDVGEDDLSFTCGDEGDELHGVLFVTAPAITHPTERGERLVVAVDTTDQVRLFQRLVEAQKLEVVGQLAGGVAHDFNNFLTAISGYLDLVLLRDALGPADRADVEQARRGVGRAATVVARLLTAGRHQVDQPEDVDLAAHLTSPDSLLGSVVPSAIELVVDVASAVDPIVRIDPTKLDQVLLNLVINARDAIDGDGTIRIQVRTDDSADVVLAVSDDGCGMDANVVRRALEPFFSTKGRDGTGLGLSTARAIVEEAGGRIEIDSVPGEGSTFRLVLPRSTTAGEPGRTTPSATAGPELGEQVGHARTALVVDDDDTVRLLVARLLESDGWDVITASDGFEALALGAEEIEEIDVLLTDVRMPGLAGPELAHRLRTRRASLPVVLMSGYVANEHEAIQMLDEPVRFVAKPFVTDVLLGALDAVCAAVSEGRASGGRSGRPPTGT